MEKRKVLLGMSGGVDSSVAAILLQRQGYEVIGATMVLFDTTCDKNCGSENAVEDAKRVCEVLGIEHHVLDFKEDFSKYVMDDFVRTYEKLETPNPCIACNQYIKFGKMYEAAKNLGCEYMATGHYAKTEYDEKYGCYVLKKANAVNKDQTYVLYNMPRDMVSHIVFPLSDFEDKEQIRQIAREAGLSIASKKESQEICFIPDDDHVKFLQEHMETKMKDGNIVNKEGTILGKHQGLYRYTIGQRRGLGIASPHPLYVVKLQKENNEVLVGEEKDIFSKELVVYDINYILMETVEEELAVKAKIRYSAKEEEATLIPISKTEAKLVFKNPVRAITPGQSVVCYIGEYVLGGGKIR